MKSIYIKRKIEGTILKFFNRPEIIGVVGPRQAGKTTTLKRIIATLPQAVYLSFDDKNTLGLFEKDTDTFIRIYIKGNKYLFIDEFHYARNGGKILKYIYDNQKIKIIISGSSVLDLTVKAVKYLVGRIVIFSLYPFDFEEFISAQAPNYLKVYLNYQEKITRDQIIDISPLLHQKLSEYYEEYLRFGGYPAVVLENEEALKQELLRGIYNTYFLREIKDILGLVDDYKLNNLIKGLALQIGNLINYNELANISGFTYPSIKKYTNFLEKTYICKFVRPFFKNKRVEIVKNPKVYFFDTGLRNTILQDFRKLQERPDQGGLLENGLAMQLIKQDSDFNFWRNKKKNEVDFVFQKNNKLTAIEVKSLKRNIKTTSLNAFKNLYPSAVTLTTFKNQEGNLIGRESVPLYLL